MNSKINLNIVSQDCKSCGAGELPKTMMYKANKVWADKLKSQNYTVIDIGYPQGQSLSQSVFYNMELSTLFP